MLRNMCVCKFYTRTSSPLTFDYSCIFVTNCLPVNNPKTLMSSKRIQFQACQKGGRGQAAWRWEGAAWRNETRAWRGMPKTPSPNTALVKALIFKAANSKPVKSCTHMKKISSRAFLVLLNNTFLIILYVKNTCRIRRHFRLL